MNINGIFQNYDIYNGMDPINPLFLPKVCIGCQIIRLPRFIGIINGMMVVMHGFCLAGYFESPQMLEELEDDKYKAFHRKTSLSSQ